MSNLKINSNLFIGAAELNRLQYFLQDVGYKKNILDNSVSFGLIKSNRDITFANGLISADTDVIISSITTKTVKHNALSAIDSNGNFLSSPIANQIAIPGDNNWYWIRVAYIATNIEKGTFAIDVNGNLTSSGAEMTKLLRGIKNIPSRVRFPNATYNTLDYDILSITDDNTAVLNGVSFTAETSLQMSVVGSFTYGVAVDPSNKQIFNYDSRTITLVPEISLNVAPVSGYTKGLTFYLARVKSDGTNLTIQDKRTEYWETKGSNESIDIQTTVNNLIGVESVKYNHIFSPGDKNLVTIGWGFRSNNWTVNSNTNVLTLSTGLGGKYKSVSDFNNGDFDGWRLYYANGQYSKIVTSITSGGAINLTLDTLNVDNLSVDGGNTFETSQYVIATPNAEEIEIAYLTNPVDTQSTLDKTVIFPINELFGTTEVAVYLDPSVLYNIKYRYKVFKDYSEYVVIPSDIDNGYFIESSFDNDGNIIGGGTRQTYTNDPSVGFIQLNLSSNAYKNFVFKVDKGDKIGVTTISSITSPYILQVGVNDNYLKIIGDVVLTSNSTIILSATSAVSGNEFRIHFDTNSFNLNGFTLSIVDGSTSSAIKNIIDGDLYMIKNVENGIVFTCVNDGTNWNIYQNYDLGRPNEVIDLYNVVPSNLFNTFSLGKVKGLFGYTLANGTNGGPDLRGMFIPGYNPADPDYSTIGATGGSKSNTLTNANLPPLDIPSGYDGPHPKPADGGGADEYYPSGHAVIGSSDPIENRPPFFTLIKAYKLF